MFRTCYVCFECFVDEINNNNKFIILRFWKPVIASRLLVPFFNLQNIIPSAVKINKQTNTSQSINLLIRSNHILHTKVGYYLVYLQRRLAMLRKTRAKYNIIHFKCITTQIILSSIKCYLRTNYSVNNNIINMSI